MLSYLPPHDVNCRVLHGVALSQRLAIRPSRALLSSSAVRPNRDLVLLGKLATSSHRFLKRRLSPAFVSRSRSPNRHFWTRSDRRHLAKSAAIRVPAHTTRPEPKPSACATSGFARQVSLHAPYKMITRSVGQKLELENILVSVRKTENALMSIRGSLLGDNPMREPRGSRPTIRNRDGQANTIRDGAKRKTSSNRISTFLLFATVVAAPFRMVRRILPALLFGAPFSALRQSPRRHGAFKLANSLFLV